MADVEDVIDQVKWQADRKRGGRIVTEDLIPFADMAYREAWDIILGSYDDYLVTVTNSFALVGGAGSGQTKALESDFYKLLEVQRQGGDGHWNEVPLYRPDRSRSLSYRLEDANLVIEPANRAAGTYRYRYVYQLEALTDEDDEIRDVNGWVQQYMVDVLAVRCKIRDEESVSTLLQLRVALEERVKKMAANRNAGRPRQALDRRRRCVDGW